MVSMEVFSIGFFIGLEEGGRGSRKHQRQQDNDIPLHPGKLT